jgi:hypothetical protein
MVTKREHTLYLLAGVLATISGVRELVEGEYLKTAENVCFLVLVLMLAFRFPARPLWQRMSMHSLIALQLGLFAYRIALRNLG